MLFNRGDQPRSIELDFVKHLGCPPNTSLTLRDLWKYETLSSTQNVFKSAKIPSHGVLMLRAFGTDCTGIPAPLVQYDPRDAL